VDTEPVTQAIRHES